MIFVFLLLNVLFIMGFCSWQYQSTLQEKRRRALEGKACPFHYQWSKTWTCYLQLLRRHTVRVTSGKALSPSPASLKEFCTLVSRDIFVSRLLPFTANCQFARLTQDSLCSMWSLLQNVWFLCMYASDLFLLVSVKSAFIHKCIIVVIIGCEMRWEFSTLRCGKLI